MVGPERSKQPRELDRTGFLTLSRLVEAANELPDCCNVPLESGPVCFDLKEISVGEITSTQRKTTREKKELK